jgi:hypothetical protein
VPWSLSRLGLLGLEGAELEGLWPFAFYRGASGRYEVEVKAFTSTVPNNLRRWSYALYAYAEARSPLREGCRVMRFKGAVALELNDERYVKAWIMLRDVPADDNMAVVGELAGPEEELIASLVPEFSRVKLEPVP